MKNNPKHPLFIVSKGRADSRLTAKSLQKMGVPFFIIVEEKEYETYCRVIPREQVLILPERYFDEYDCFDEHGRTKSTGPGPARNFAWDYAISIGAEWHWVMDDNINGFYRLYNNIKTPVGCGGIFRAMEDFCERYENVTMAGPNYFMFASRKTKMPPYVLNTRIYSCNLIRNNAPFRWRGRYNEDTDISLRMLKAGNCTVQFNAFLQYKMPTQTLKGGNTDEFYHKEGTLRKGEKYADNGTLAKSEMQVAMHPDVSKLTWKFGRWHHHVDYSYFMKFNKLKKVPGIVIPRSINNFGMKLIYVNPETV